MPNPPEEYRFKPGQSGNPAGYSRGRRTTDALLRLIDQMGADEAIAKRWLKAILDGDFRYFKEYIDRTEGRTPETVKVEAEARPQPPSPDVVLQAASILKELGIARPDPVLPAHPDAAPTGVPADG